MGGLKTALAFTKNLFTTGAITECSRHVELEICKHIPREGTHVIIEYGMGHGNITREILNVMSPTSKLYAFEVNRSFCEHVEGEINDDRLVVVNDDAEHVRNHVSEPVSSVIASIPFSFFSKEKGMKIIQDSYDMLLDGGVYSQALYTKFNFKKFEKVFDDCRILKLPHHIPSEYIYHCKKSE